MKKTLKSLAALIALLCLGFNSLLLIKRPAPQGFSLWIPRLLAGALAPFFGLAGLISALVGLFTGAPLAVAAGAYSARIAWQYLKKVVVQAHLNMYPRFESAFGPDWETRLTIKNSPQHKEAMLRWRWNWFVQRDPHPCLERNVPFWADPVSGRELLCDVWLPPDRTLPTGLGFLYFHGSACYYHTNQDKTPLESLRAQAENPPLGGLLSRTMLAISGSREKSQEITRKFATMSMAGRLEPVVGSAPDVVPTLYELYSPVSHAGPGAPPTFMVQGADDLIVPLAANQRLAERLAVSGVPVVHLILPHTDHGFDLMLPRQSPPTRSALYEPDRFLALL